jgi:hypothetical protein
MGDRKGGAMTPRAAASPGAAGQPTAVPVEQVRDALAHLYDPGHLQTHPLADLAGGSERTGRGRALQRALLEAVEALKPARDGNPGPKALRRYRLLKRRYVDGLSPEAVQRELLIGRSEYYREHEQAVSAVASLLGELLGGVGPPPDRGFPAWAPSEPAGGVAAQLRIPATSFVGREDHLAEVIRLLGTTRLLTLTGAGGCGKTRLALHAASDLRAVFPAGVHVVELAPLADAELVEGAVAAVLGLRDNPRATDARSAAPLRRRQALAAGAGQLRARRRRVRASGRRAAPRDVVGPAAGDQPGGAAGRR